MKQSYYMSLETGELLTWNEMQRVFAEEYDGGDPTNSIGWQEYFQKVEV